MFFAGMLPAGDSDNPSPLGTGPVNPALKRFGRSVIFYVSFDGHEKAEITRGDPNPQGDARWPEALKDPSKLYAPGVYGQGLRATDFRLTYTCTNAVLGSTGAMTLWVKPETLNHKGTYWWPGMLHALEGRYQLMFGRIGDPRNHEALYAHLAHAKANVSAVCGGSMESWKTGEWHLFVINWDRTAVELSLDGATPGRANLKTGIESDTAGGLRAILLCPSEDIFIYDEFMVTDVPLQATETRWLWEEGRKAINP